MGYRSDVALALSGAGQRRLMHAASETDNETRQDLKDLLQSGLVREDEGTQDALYFWDDIKWYPDCFPGPGFLEAFLESLEPEEYLFLRLGEDWDDSQSRGLWWENPFEACMVRRIEFI
ncbi:hypothetical protein [Desulfocurvus sp.]|jgi:hypothetical protein|uniref:hypothetical protein n=1 Tax=Desulfocurvus sp. TaxID=2871698 RepID=UPI0025C524C1|nr:hypothetical protein [Desulfocurvus sp.]MCK9241258.1 hypothetical protein [Desulfocurvus sp.]